MLPLKAAKADLIGKYKLHLKISFILSIALVILAFKFSPMPRKNETIKVDDSEIIKLTDTEPTTQKPKVPEPPQAPKIIEAELDQEIDEIILPDVGINENKNFNKPGPPIVDKPVLEDENWDYYRIEIKPEIIGGIEALYKKLHYTEIARRTGIVGTVVIDLIVDKDGNPKDVKAVKKIGGGLDEIALNAVKDLKFNPGIQAGKPVSVKMTIPIKFVLK